MEKIISINKEVETPIKEIEQSLFCGSEHGYCPYYKNKTCTKFHEALHFCDDWERCESCLNAAE